MIERRYGFLAGLDFARLPADRVAGSLASLGYQAVAWPLARFDPLITTLAERQALVHVTQVAGLRVSEWVLQLDYIHLDPAVRRQRLEHSQSAIRCVAEMDPSAPLNLFTGPAPWDPTAPRLGKDLPEGAAWDMLRAAFDVLVPQAEKEGVRLAIEPVFGHLAHDYYTTLPLLQWYPSPNFGVNFDPSHGILVGNDTAWVARQFGSRIFHVHLKDAVGVSGGLPGETFLFPLLGEGRVPWHDFFTALDFIGYNGYLTVEFESFIYYSQVLKNDPVAAARLSLELLRNL